MASSSSSSALELRRVQGGEFPTGGERGSCLLQRRPLRLQMTTRRRPTEATVLATTSGVPALRSTIAGLPEKRWESVLRRPQPLLPPISTEGREPISAEMLDKWTRDSVGEIVRNTRGGSPFFVHIFSDSILRLEMEAALPDSWPRIKRRWEKENNRRPDAVILVEELGVTNGDQQDICSCCCSGSNVAPAYGEKAAAVAAAPAAQQLPAGRATSKTWGLLVQGRGTGCAACYILNTNRVRSSVGSCTHFCLTRGRLGEPLDVQLKRSWLNRS